MLAALFTGSSRLMSLLGAQKETFTANQCIQERVEQARGASWAQITDQSYVQNTLLSTATTSAATLQGAVETLTISAYPANATSSIQVTRQNGAVALNLGNSTMSGNGAVRLDYQLAWLSQRSRQRIRQISFIVAKGGIGN